VRLNAAKSHSLIFSIVFNDCSCPIGMFPLSCNNCRRPCRNSFSCGPAYTQEPAGVAQPVVAVRLPHAGNPNSTDNHSRGNPHSTDNHSTGNPRRPSNMAMLHHPPTTRVPRETQTLREIRGHHEIRGQRGIHGHREIHRHGRL
jgi:hypothetical protein